METLTQCPVCGNDQFSPFLVCKDYLVSKEDFTIQQCDNCALRFTNPRPSEETIGSYYKSEQYISHNDSSTGLIDTAYRAVRSYTLRSKLDLINKLYGGVGRVLDVGCGTGAFLETCKVNGWQIVGVEPDPDARAVSVEKLQMQVEPSLHTLTKTNKFDIISLWHVLEHMPNLEETIPRLRELLDEEGTLLIAVPNSDSYDARYFERHWAAYDVPRHLYHFNPLTLNALLKKHNFELIQQRAMPFDAFYVSMLSTRYKTGKTDYLKSVRTGFISNVKARKTGNSSSITYLFKKAR